MAKLKQPEPEVTATKRPRRWYQLSLTTWILVGLVVGGVLGKVSPAWGNRVYFLRDIFLNLIKSIIAPLVFSTLVVGVAGGGDLKKVGRMGAKALIYFEIVTTVALFIGLGVVNFTKPGRGVVLTGDTAAIQSIQQTQPQDLAHTLVHIFPASIVDAMVRGDVLQIVAFAIIFAMAVSALGEKGRPILRACESLSQIMFRFTGYVMMFAPIGVGAAMAHTIATQGLGVLKNLGLLIGSLYLALVIFIVVVFGAVALLFRIPVLKFIKAVREPATIAFVTTSSESALPKAMEVMERLGVPPRIVGFVIPTGYSFNLDGTTLYLAMASVFVAQAAEGSGAPHLGLAQQIVMMLTLMLTSKGVAAVPRAALVILLATLNGFVPGYGALGVAVIFGVDELMDMGRTCVNVVGNCLATCVVARWEGEFDDERAAVFGTPAEIALDLKEGEPAFAQAAKEEYSYAPQVGDAHQDSPQSTRKERAGKIAVAGGITACISALAFLWGNNYINNFSNMMRASLSNLIGQTDSTYVLAQWCVTLGIIGFIVGLILFIVGMVLRSV